MNTQITVLPAGNFEKADTAQAAVQPESPAPFFPPPASIPSPQPDLAVAKHFLDTVHSRSKTACIQIFPDNAQNELRGNLNISVPVKLPDLEIFVPDNLTGAGIFVCINTLPPNANDRKKGRISQINAFVADLDHAPIEPVLNFSLKPHLICESSPQKYHAWWLIAPEPVDESLFNNLQLSIAKKFNGDPAVKDIARVIRIPGFLHNKDKPFLSRVLQDNSDLPRYKLADIQAAFPISQKTRPTPTPPIFNSTTDWVLDQLPASAELGKQNDKGYYNVKCPYADSDHKHPKSPRDGDSHCGYSPASDPSRHGDFSCQHKNCRLYNNRVDFETRFQEFAKYYGLKAPVVPPIKNPASASKLKVQTAAGLHVKNINWLVDKMIAASGLTIIGGQQGSGKTQLTSYLGVHFATGNDLPFAKVLGGPRRVVYITGESDLEHNLLPSFLANGLKLNDEALSRLCKYDGFETQDVNGNDVFEYFSAKNALQHFEMLKQEFPDVGVIFIDPLTAYMGGRSDTNNLAQTQALLNPIQEWAMNNHVAVIGIMHLKKSLDDSDVLNHLNGSVAFTTAPRNVFYFVTDKNVTAQTADGKVYFPAAWLAHVKHNDSSCQGNIKITRSLVDVVDGNVTRVCIKINASSDANFDDIKNILEANKINQKELDKLILSLFAASPKGVSVNEFNNELKDYTARQKRLARERLGITSGHQRTGKNTTRRVWILNASQADLPIMSDSAMAFHKKLEDMGVKLQ